MHAEAKAAKEELPAFWSLQARFQYPVKHLKSAAPRLSAKSGSPTPTKTNL
jgi:hypothetical protein